MIKRMEHGQRVKQWLVVADVCRALNTSPNKILEFQSLSLVALQNALEPILAVVCDDPSFGHEPAEDARKIAQILFDVIEAVGQLPEDISDDIGFRVAGHLAAVRMRD